MPEDRKAITLRLPLPLLKAIDTACLAEGTPRHDWLVAALFVALAEGAVEQDVGHVERKTRQDIEALVCSHPMGESLAAMAFNLARTLDQGAGQLQAALARELRATLNDLAKYEHGGAPDDDDAPDLGAPALGNASDDDPSDPW